MFDPTEYELLDFGREVKLETFAGVSVQRPCPAAVAASRQRSVNADLIYRLSSKGEEKGEWSNLDNSPADWIIQHDNIRFSLKPTPFGHLGVFPEQASNWDWLRKNCGKFTGAKVLNLFAYTGGTTLTLADLGCEVTHVDAAKNVVQWARENADLSGLRDAPIRWIAEDVMRFLKREIKRGRNYDIVVADPPSFGRGPKKETWKIERDFPELINCVHTLTNGSPRALLFSGHTMTFNQKQMLAVLRQRFRGNDLQFESGLMSLCSSDGRKLNAGHFVRVF